MAAHFLHSRYPHARTRYRPPLHPPGIPPTPLLLLLPPPKKTKPTAPRRNPLLRSLYPRSLGLYFYDLHRNLIEEFVAEFGPNIGLVNGREAEEESCADGSFEREDELGEDGAKSVLENEGEEFSILLFFGGLFFKLAFDFLFEGVGKELELVFGLSFVDPFVDGLDPL